MIFILTITYEVFVFRRKICFHRVKNIYIYNLFFVKLVPIFLYNVL